MARLAFWRHREAPPAAESFALTPLPASVRPPPTKERLVNAYLGKIQYGGNLETPFYVSPLWTAAIATSKESDNIEDFKKKFVVTSENVLEVKGSFDDALKLAAQRANSSLNYRQMQAVIRGEADQWFVVATGAVEGEKFNAIALDGSVNGNPFNDTFRRVTGITLTDEFEVAALVGGAVYKDFRAKEERTDDRFETLSERTHSAWDVSKE